MQLESTLFGVCVVQIKPQLEKLLNLLPDSLTKEIKLTQDLMELFIKYQIPAKLFTFEGPASADAEQRLSAVKSHVDVLHKMLAQGKSAALLQNEREAEYVTGGAPESVRHEHGLVPTPESRHYTAVCDVCQVTGSSNFCCLKCNWDICSSCLTAERNVKAFASKIAKMAAEAASNLDAFKVDRKANAVMLSPANSDDEDEEMDSIVIDNGGGLIKAGFALDEVPRSIFPSIGKITKYVKRYLMSPLSLSLNN